MTRTLILALALILAPLPALSGNADGNICVTNNSDDTHLFVVEAQDGTRIVRELEPQKTICLPSTGPGTVAAFDDIDSVEGCTRLASPGVPMVLQEFANFDRCRWQDQ